MRSSDLRWFIRTWLYCICWILWLWTAITNGSRCSYLKIISTPFLKASVLIEGVRWSVGSARGPWLSLLAVILSVITGPGSIILMIRYLSILSPWLSLLTGVLSVITVPWSIILMLRYLSRLTYRAASKWFLGPGKRFTINASKFSDTVYSKLTSCMW